jgi:hypothetical protein
LLLSSRTRGLASEARDPDHAADPTQMPHLGRFLRVLAPLAVLGAASACKPKTVTAGAPTPVATVSTSVSTTHTDSAAPVEMRPSSARYQPGAELAYQFVNHSDDTYSVSPCQRTIERLVDGSWQAVMEQPRTCTMEAWVLGPHASRDGATTLPPTLAPGRYRVAVDLTRESAPAGEQSKLHVTSGGFDIAP